MRFFAVLAVCLGLLLVLSPADSQTAGAQSPTSARAQRALVLGGGGVTGEAWEVGILKGLRDAGVDLTQADLVVGTSAGAIVGTSLRVGRPLDVMYDRRLAPPAGRGLGLGGVDLAYYQETSRLWQRPDATEAQRIETGQRAMAATQVIPEDAWVQQWDSALGIPDWPSQPLMITAVDVADGTTRLIDGTQGAPIARAVAASTALPGLVAPISIGDHRYIDGGVAGDHLDAPAGYGLVVGVTLGSPLSTVREIEQLRGQGSQVMNIVADAESRAARGTDNMDPTYVRASAEAGLRQAATVAADLDRFWNGASPGR